MIDKIENLRSMLDEFGACSFDKGYSVANGSGDAARHHDDREKAKAALLAEIDALQARVADLEQQLAGCGEAVAHDAPAGGK